MHSNNVVIITDSKTETKNEKADALITKIPNNILGILTADCVPVLLYDYKKQIISAIHVGWRGAKNKIINITIQKMCLMGSNPINIIAALGPCIGKNSYEVSKDLYDEFTNENYKLKKFFKKLKTQKFLFDLSGIVINQLLSEKILKSNISYSNYDTLAEKKLFYSYRRDSK